MEGLDLCVRQPLLEWLPEETLFSLCSRHHVLFGHGVSSRTTTLLFGQRRFGAQHDFPSHLEALASRTCGLLGSADEIASARTLLKFYAPFVKPGLADQAARSMASPSVAHLKFKLGLLTSRFGANHPLKACAGCMEDDLRTHGWMYWHLPHQYPGVWICERHGQVLQESLVKSNGVERFAWKLPSGPSMRRPITDNESSFRPAFEALARLIIELVHHPIPHLNLDRWFEVYRRGLAAKGWISTGGGLRMAKASKNFVQFVAPLRVVPELAPLAATEQSAASQLSIVLRPPRTGTHPLRHLITVLWLFGDANSWREAIAEVQTPAAAGRPTEGAFAADATPSKKEKLLALIAEERPASISDLARRLGLSTQTALTLAARANLPIARRPKKLDDTLRKNVVQELRRGRSKQAVALRYELSEPTINRLLACEPGLHASWKLARFERARRLHRHRWEGIRRAYPLAALKWMRELYPATFSWLYRNDRNWLVSQSPEKAVQRHTSAHYAVWDSRDAELSAAVRRAVQDLRCTGTAPIRLWQLIQLVPDLRPKLGRMDRLPLAKREIDAALGRHKASQEGCMF